MQFIAIDPGLSTGVALFADGMLMKTRLVINTSEALHATARTIDDILQANEQIAVIVIEDYRIYPNKALEHTHSDVPVARLIGMIEYLASLRQIKLVKQRAIEAKHVCADEFLREHHLWSNTPHTRDATRHGALYLMKQFIIAKDGRHVAV